MPVSLLQPQEIELHYLLPTLRRELALAMKARGTGQRQIAQLLGVTEAAVTQYIKARRATTVRLSRSLRREIAGAAARISDRASMLSEVQRLLALALDRRFTCTLHRRYAKLPPRCEVCFVK